MSKNQVKEPKDKSSRTDGQQSPATPTPAAQEFGEGNYVAARNYDKAAETFAKSGRVEQAAKDAAPASASEAAELKDAEAKGRAKSKGEDPALHVKGLFQNSPKS